MLAYQVISPLAMGETVGTGYVSMCVIGVLICLILQAILYGWGLDVSHKAAYNTLLRLRTSLKKARCYDFIMELPDGFETMVGEGGESLSGGEKQRISIARCILKDAPIVILDEATASVDTDNESYIQEAINELVKGKTLSVIAHRLNTIRNADQILVISDGKIAQSGTHETLMEEPGIYRSFVNVRESSRGWNNRGY